LKSEFSRPLKPWEVIGGLIFAGLVIWWLASSSGSKNTAVDLATDTKPAVAQTAASAGTVADEPPLGKKEAGLALSDYIGRAKAVTDAAAMMSEVYLSKIKQDMAWNDLDKFREDAEQARDSAQKAQEALGEIQIPLNLTDADAAQFDNVATAFADIAIARVSLAVDISVYANTGLHDDGETNKDIADSKRATKGLKQKALAAYKHFGYAPEQIDESTLTIKKGLAS
jgi:hypothetical protein